MVRGFNQFREHFRAYVDQYMLIGGAACDLLMDEVGLAFRATKDLDIVLCVEALNVTFVEAFWAFVRDGKYQVQRSTTGEKRYYRFFKPENEEYPYMLELFARGPDLFELVEGAHLTPVPMDEEVSNLSAILLNDAYYAFLHSGKRIIEGIPIVGPAHLIPLKARAWLELTQRKEAGADIDAKDIAKHKNDVFRLYQILDPGSKIVVPEQIRADMRTFLEAMRSETIDLKKLGIRERNLAVILAEFEKYYLNDR